MSFILSKIDYCNALYYGMSAKNIYKLQAVQNSSAKLVSKLNRFDNISITEIIRTHHWLRVKDRISFKILLITHKALWNKAPIEIQSLLRRSKSSRNESLRHEVSHGKYGDRSFKVAAPKLWNAVPPEIEHISV